MVDFEKLKKTDTNILWLEYLESSRRLNALLEMQANGLFTDGKKIGFRSRAQFQQPGKARLYGKDLTLGGKEISQEMVYNVVGRRFHECLKRESQKEELYELSDKELVHQVCRKERLTFFNFLRMNEVDGESITEETIKGMLNREYMVYFQREGRVADVYRPERGFRRPVLNSLNREFTFEWQK